jgi:hypothetical protein
VRTGIPFSGSLVFSRNILGVIALSPELTATDNLFGPPGVTYATGDAVRGLELQDSQDMFNISPDLRTLTFSFTTWDNIDELRIITDGLIPVDANDNTTVTPEPKFWIVLALGLPALAGYRRFKLSRLRCGNQSRH